MAQTAQAYEIRHIFKQPSKFCRYKQHQHESSVSKVARSFLPQICTPPLPHGVNRTEGTNVTTPLISQYGLISEE
jgi:hypothetical protein